MHYHHFQPSLQLTPDDLNQIKHLAQAHRTPQAMARRAQLIQLSHAHPDWSARRLAHILNRHESWVRKWRRRWKETHSLKDASTFRCATSIFLNRTSTSDSAGM